MSDVRVVPLRCGVLRAAGEAFVAGTDGDIDLQVWSFLVQHPAGTVLFDTGMHPTLRSDPGGRIGGLARLFEIHFDEGDDVTAQVAAAGVDPGSIDVVVCSHLHFDHAGGNALLPAARIITQRREWEHARSDAGAGYVAEDWDTGQDLQLVDGEHDLFGDGRVRCLPTFGHTPGHQSLLVRTDGGDLVLTADSCYLRESLERRALPAFGWDLDMQAGVLDELAALEAAGATLIFGHDPDLSADARRLTHASAE